MPEARAGDLFSKGSHSARQAQMEMEMEMGMGMEIKVDCSRD